jgi:hypothetical protein
MLKCSVSQTFMATGTKEQRMNSKILLLLLVACGVAACGTYNLGNVRPQPNRTADQQQLDMLTCKDQANLAVNSAGHQTADFFLGLTVVGAPVAYANDKSRARAVFANCMQARGYVVTLPGEGVPPASTVAVTAAAPVPGSDQLALALPGGFVLRPAPEELKDVGAVFYAINGTLDIGVTVIPLRHEGVTDLTAYASTRRAREADALKEATWSEVTLLEIGGRNAARFRVSGTTSSNFKITYVSTFIEGHDQIVFVNAWSGATNALQQMTVLESLGATVSGIS